MDNENNNKPEVTEENNPTSYNKEDTLCWTCRYSTGIPIGTPSKPLCASCTKASGASPTANFRCPWVANQTPVPGWEATEMELTSSISGRESSYLVRSCPYYKPDLQGQISALSREEVGLYIDLPPELIATHVGAAKLILYTALQREEEYKLILSGRKDIGQVYQATDEAKKHAGAATLLVDLPEVPTPIDPKIRGLALKDLLAWYEIDSKLFDNGSIKITLKRLKILKEKIELVKKRRRAKRIRQARAAEEAAYKSTEEYRKMHERYERRKQRERELWGEPPKSCH